MRTLTPIILVLVAIALFVWYIDPTYGTIKTLRQEEATFDAALTRSRELQETRDQLLSKYNTFSPDALTRLGKLILDHVDNVRLILDLDGIASRYGMRVRNVTLDDAAAKVSAVRVGPDESPYESLDLRFTVSGQYSTFRQFLSDLEHSLRLVDVVGLHFSSNESGIYDYTVSLRTYWLTP